MSERRTDEIATAVGLGACVLVILAAWEAWKLANWLGWVIPYELLAIPSVLSALIISPASNWARTWVDRRAHRSTTDS